MGLSKTTWRVLGVLAALALLALWRSAGRPEPDPLDSAAAPPSAAVSLDQALSMPAPRPAEGAALEPRRVEVCEQAPAWTTDLEYIPEPVFQKIITAQKRQLRRLSERFVQDADPFTRGVGLTLMGDAEIQDRAAAQAANPLTVRAAPPTGEDSGVELTASERRLVDKAARSTDARLHVLALPHCEFMRDPASRCADLSWQRAAELAADNGYLWLRAAHEQRSGGNPQAERENLDRAIRSTEFETFERQRSALMASAALASSTPFERLAMAFDLPREGEGLDPVVLDYLGKRCTGRVAPAERARCQQVADRLARTEAYWSQHLGASLAIALAPDPQRARALQQALAARSARREALAGKHIGEDPSCAAADAHLKAVVASASRINSVDQPAAKERGQ